MASFSGVGSASLRCLTIAAESLTDRREQEEVLTIFARIKREGGWRIQFVIDDLPEIWGWNRPQVGTAAETVATVPPTTTATTTSSSATANRLDIPPNLFPRGQISPATMPSVSLEHQYPSQPGYHQPYLHQSQPQQQPEKHPQQHPQQQHTVSPPKKPPAGIINPLYHNADFSKPDPPYKDFYVPPLSSLPPRSLSSGQPSQSQLQPASKPTYLTRNNIYKGTSLT